MIPSQSFETAQFERVAVHVHADADTASAVLAAEIAAAIRERAAAGRHFVLGLATGSTPVRLYRRLIAMHRDEGLSFRNVVSFNLDEYYGLAPTHPESYRRFMQEQLFDRIDLAPENAHLPDGTVARHDVFAHCREYEARIALAGGLDLQVLGIGRTGHIGFNEPGSNPESRTRLVTLDSLTRRDAARDFLGEANVPRHAITMGVGTILEARKVVLLAWGAAKAAVVAQAVEAPQDAALPASFLQRHGACRFLLDTPAASELTRFKHPWRTGPVEWTARLRRKAVVWLGRQTAKPILKLVDEDYTVHRLADLITEQGPAYNLNIRIFNELQHTITGWPGGKPGADDSTRPERAEPASKRVLVLSPEPLDAERAMAGTLHRLSDQGHDLTLGCLTSGNLAVPDLLVWLATDLVHEMDAGARSGLAALVRQHLECKGPFDLDTQEIRRVKAAIRRGESRAAAEICGVARSRIRFLDLPFYEAGRYRRFQPGETDVARLSELLEELRPHAIFATGSEADPSSVAAVTFRLLREAWEHANPQGWRRDCRVWLYREGDRALSLHLIDMAVPLSPAEMADKLEAVYRHQSQRSQTPMSRESGAEAWQQASLLDRATAREYDALGLPEYEAIETFHQWNGSVGEALQ